MSFVIKNLKVFDIEYPNIEIKPNVHTLIVGKSGSGKSTLLKLLNRTVKKSRGNIYYNGEDIDSFEVCAYRKRVMLCNQDVYLFDNTIKENFEIYHSYIGTKVEEGRIKELLKCCCIDLPLDKDCKTLSGGEKHRVFIAICLSFDFEVLMLDEPTSALDEENSVHVIKNILEYTKGKTVIIVTHSPLIMENFGQYTIDIGGKTIDENIMKREEE